MPTYVCYTSKALTYVCPNVKKIFGLSREHVYKLKKIQRLLNGTVCDIATLKTQGEIQNIEWSITDSGEQEHFLIISAKLASLNAGTVLYVIHAITTLKESQASYRNSITDFEDLFNKAAVPLCFVNKEA